jgi:hypothetical protein
MRPSDPLFTKLASTAHVEMLRGRRFPRRPRSARSN